jgi:hypothetical protein
MYCFHLQGRIVNELRRSKQSSDKIEKKMEIVGDPEGKRPLGSPVYMWRIILKMDVREIGLDGLDLMWLRIGTSGGLL